MSSCLVSKVSFKINSRKVTFRLKSSKSSKKKVLVMKMKRSYRIGARLLLKDEILQVG